MNYSLKNYIAENQYETKIENGEFLRYEICITFSVQKFVAKVFSD